MTLAQINAKIFQEIMKDEHEGGSELLKSMDKIEDLCSDRSKLYSKFDLPTSQEEFDKNVTDRILLSTLFSDTTMIVSNSNFGTYHKTEEYIPAEIDELLGYYDLIDDRKKIQGISAGSFVFTDNEGEYLEKNFQPLFESERLTLSPNRNLMIIAGTQDEPNIYTVPAERDRIKNLWRAPLTGDSQSSIPITYYTESNEQAALTQEIVLPFISGLSIKDFAQVLDDENDLLSSFRKELKTLTQLKKDEKKHSAEVYQDLIRPRVDKITQKFKSVSEIHKLKVSGVVLVTASLSLLSIAFADYLAAASTMLSVGTGSAGFVKFESEYQTEIANLKSDPLYLLWKLRKAKKK
jgi:hypothetical protein